MKKKCVLILLFIMSFFLTPSNAQGILQTIIDSAIAGSTLNISAGTYTESISISKPLTLICFGGCVIDVTGLSSGVEIDASDVVFSGFEIIGDTSTIYGIVIRPSSTNITISDNLIHGMKFPNPNNPSPLAYGILSYGKSITEKPSNLAIYNNTIYDIAGSAISLGTYNDSTFIDGNTFYLIDTVFYQGLPLNVGVQAELATNLTITNNAFNELIFGSNLINCTSASITNNSYNATEILLSTTYPHNHTFSDTPWWAVLYPVSSTETYQFYFSDLLLIPQALLSTLTSSEVTYVPDNNFEQKLISLGLDDYLNDSVNTWHIDTLTYLDLANCSIENLIGIEDFISLQKLYCGYNNIEFLDFTNNIDLTTLYCQTNNISSLVLPSLNSMLVDLYCYNNSINFLDISSSLTLKKLNCYGNNLNELDLSNNIYLEELSCGYNNISSLDLSNNLYLKDMYCHNNSLWYLDLKNGNNYNMQIDTRNNPSLSCISVDDVLYAENQWGNVFGYVDAWTFFDNDCISLSLEKEIINKNLIKTINILGWEVKETPNNILIHIFDNGEVEKRFNFE